MADYCTYFDSRYLSRGLTLYHSLRRVSPDCQLWVLCLDDACYETLRALRLAGVSPMKLSDIESADLKFFATKNNRSTLEYYFTCTPVFISFLLSSNPNIDTITYVDADIYFYEDPEILFDDFRDASVQIVPHRYSERNRALEKWGLYNVGWVTFRRDEAGLSCLSWWRECCIEWCYDRLEGDRFADQKYLDQFPRKFSRVQVVAHHGVNVAPWNLDTGSLTRSAGGELSFRGESLIFFHFHKLRQVAPSLWQTRLGDYGASLDRATRDWLYVPYIRQLAAAEREVRALRRDEQRPQPLLRGGTRPVRALGNGVRAIAAGLRRDSIFCIA